MFDKVILIGAGGIGSILLEPLTRFLMYHREGTLNIHVYDGDIYEEKNQQRQLFPLEFIGKNKAKAQAERLQSFAPNLIAHAQYVDRAVLSDAINRSESEFPLVIAAVDRDMSRKVVVDALDALDPDFYNYACILPGNDFESANCFTYTRVQGVHKPMHPFPYCEQWANPKDTIPGACGDKSVSAPQLIAANMKAASLALDAVTALLDRKMPEKLFGVKCWSLYTQSYELLPSSEFKDGRLQVPQPVRPGQQGLSVM